MMITSFNIVGGSKGEISVLRELMQGVEVEMFRFHDQF
jgi:hypothetical protein